MYRSGAEQKIRKFLVDNNYIDCIIQLPSNLFFGTPIATCIMVLKKGKRNNDVLFIDASKECVKVTNNNKLDEANITEYYFTVCCRKNVEHKASVIAYEEVKKNKYTLSVATYVEEEDEAEEINITELNMLLERIVKEEDELRNEINSIIKTIEV